MLTIPRPTQTHNTRGAYVETAAGNARGRLGMRRAASTVQTMTFVAVTQQRVCPRLPHPPRANVQLPHSGQGHVALENGCGISLQQESSVSGSSSGFHVLAGGCPRGSGGKESACSAGDPGSVPGLEDPPEEGVATHSRILAWTDRPGQLPSTGSQSRTRLSD